MYFDKLYGYLRDNKSLILSIVGLVTLVAIAVWTVMEFFGFISGLKGFNFDPFMILLLAIFGFSTIRTNNKLVEVVNNQNKIIDRIFKESKKPSPKRTTKK